MQSMSPALSVATATAAATAATAVTGVTLNLRFSLVVSPRLSVLDLRRFRLSSCFGGEAGDPVWLVFISTSTIPSFLARG